MFYLLPLGLLVSKLTNFSFGRLLVLVFLVFFVHYFFTTIYHLYTKTADEGGFAKIKGITSAVDYIYKDANGKPFGLFVFAPPVYTYNYDYVIWWYGKRKYNFIPYQDKKGTFYLLMEPDPAKPTSYKGWMETVIKVGNTLQQKTLPSGLIVEKREASK